MPLAGEREKGGGVEGERRGEGGHGGSKKMRERGVTCEPHRVVVGIEEVQYSSVQ